MIDRLRKAVRLMFFFAGVLFYYAIASPIVFVKAYVRRNGDYMFCDRCEKPLFRRGYQEESWHPTAGYYIVREDSVWHDFADAYEQYVCDACMFSDSRYIKVHGVQNPNI